MVVIALLVAVVQKNLLKRTDAQMRYAEGTEGNMVVFNVFGVGKDAFPHHCVQDRFYVGDALPVASHEAVHDGGEGLVVGKLGLSHGSKL